MGTTPGIYSTNYEKKLDINERTSVLDCVTVGLDLSTEERQSTNELLLQ